MISSHATHAGLVRTNNEDCIRTDDANGIYLLADGIGGHNAGEVASHLAVETVYAIIRKNLSHTSVDSLFELLMHAIYAAHWEVFTQAQTDPSLARMGTTLVVAIVRDSNAYIINSGDSRCYLFTSEPANGRGCVTENSVRKLAQLTRDHTVASQMLATGVTIDKISKKYFHTLTQSVGCGNPPYPEFYTTQLAPGDMLLLCSDGLTDMLSDSEIESIIDTNTSLDEIVANLVDSANAHGGRDNVSVILTKR